MVDLLTQDHCEWWSYLILLKIYDKQMVKQIFAHFKSPYMVFFYIKLI